MNSSLAVTEATEQSKIHAAVFGSMLLVLVYLGRIQELFESLTDIALGKVAFVLAVVLYLFSHGRAIRLSGIPQVKYVIVIFLAGIASIPLSVWPGESFRFLIGDYLKLMLFFFLVIKSISSYDELGTLVWGIAFSVFLLSACTFGLERVGRLSVSTTYDPNDLAFVMVVFFPLLYFMSRKEEGWRKMFLYLTLAVMVVTIVSTVSRGGFLGFLVVCTAIFLRNGKRIGQMIVPAFLILILFSLVAPQAYWDRMGTMLEPNKDYNMQEGAGRVEVWKNGLALMARNPILGVGAGCFQTAEGLFHGGFGKWSAAHNSFIQIGAELGVPGLMAFILLIYTSVQKVRLLRHSLPPERLWLVHGTEISLYGYITCGFFLSQAFSPVLYLLVALVILLANSEKVEPESA